MVATTGPDHPAQGDWHFVKVQVIETPKGTGAVASCSTCGWQGCSRTTSANHPRYMERRDVIEEQATLSAERHQHAMFRIEYDALLDDEEEEDA